jgi:hypothetical protein
MFKPIIHNLSEQCISFEAIQKYNRLISEKKLKGVTLAEKIESEREWIKECRKAFDHAVWSIERNAKGALRRNEINFERMSHYEDII